MCAVASYQGDMVVVVERCVGATLAARVTARRATPPRTYRARRLCTPHTLQTLDLRQTNIKTLIPVGKCSKSYTFDELSETLFLTKYVSIFLGI